MSLHLSRKGILRTALAVGFFFFTLEAGLRATGKYATWSERNGQGYAWFYRSSMTNSEQNCTPFESKQTLTIRTHEFTQQVYTNSLGFLDREHAADKPENTFRILTLGDSFTAGWGAGPEESWPRQMEVLLNSAPACANPDGCVEVINGGIPGFDLSCSVQVLKRDLLGYRPDLVILALNISDVTEVIQRQRVHVDVTRSRGLSMQEQEYLYRNSHVIRLVYQELLGIRGEDLIREGDERLRTRAYELLMAYMTELQSQSKQHGFDLAVLSHPFCHDILAGEYRVWGGHAAYMAFLNDLRQRDFTVIDLLPEFIKGVQKFGQEEAAWCWPQDQHFTPAGYRLFAELVTAWLTTSGRPA